jgi:DNA mismatch repair protein MutL
MPIHILPTEVASQIAAGEVIERPASVVKEVLENSLDAGATFIRIKVEGAGRRLIEIADDGCGIPADELALAVERHATSKLDKAADLFNITSLGFRGEALASIASVSRMTITSHLAGQEVGARILVEGGRAEPVQSVGAPQGTVVRVENLFYNLPARLKFLKNDLTEKRQIDNLVTRYALAYPRVRFSLLQDEKPALQTSGNGNRREVLAALYGVDTARQMLEVSADDEELRIHGFVSPVSLTRSNRREIHIFVNGRPIQDVALATALLKAYHTLLMVGRYPLAILFIDIPPAGVDVNVHPTKAEVRFREPDRIFSGVQRAVRRALLAYTPVPGLDGQLRWPQSATPRRVSLDWEMAADERVGTPRWRGWEDANGREAAQPLLQGEINIPQEQPTDSAAQAGQSQPAMPAARLSILRLVGQVAAAYLIAEGPDGLYLIDQHAAHERVLFERFMSQRASQAPAQALLQPATVELLPAQARALTDQLPLLAHLGFQVEPFGPNTFQVRAIPALLTGADPAAALRVVVEDFEEDESPFQAEIEARIIGRICKRSAVKAGKTLTHDEQRALLDDLEACASPRTCPHGRPTMIHLSVDLLERQFGRRGAR